MKGLDLEKTVEHSEAASFNLTLNLCTLQPGCVLGFGMETP